MPDELIAIQIRRGWATVTYWSPAGESTEQIPLATDDSRCHRLAEELRRLADFVEGGGVHEKNHDLHRTAY
jgi:hypothetical protein